MSFLDSASTLPRINLDAAAIRTATQGGSATHLLSLIREKLKRYLRTGPPWSVLGPVRNAIRRSSSNRVRPCP